MPAPKTARKTTGIFASAFANIDPNHVWISAPDRSGWSHDGVVLADGAPSNQQIIDACAYQYSTWQDLVDPFTNCGIQFQSSSAAPSTHSTLTPLLSQQSVSQGQQTTAQSGLTGGIFSGPIAQAQTESHNGTMINSIGLGVMGNIAFIIGAQGGVCVDFQPGFPTRGVAWGAGTLGLQIGASIDIEVFLSSLQPSQISGSFYGLTVFANLGPGVTLSVAVTEDLSQIQFFSLGIGVGFALGVAVMAGGMTNFG